MLVDRHCVGRAASRFIEQPAAGGLGAAVEGPIGAAFTPGTRVGAYRLERLLGSGGAGQVFLAVRDDATFEKQVAIKVLKRGMDTDEILRRLPSDT